MKNLILVLALLLLPTAGFAQSGKTGSLNWSLDNGTLTISGTGAMPDYEVEYSEFGPTGVTSPWYSYRTFGSGITAVNIGDGVTSIGHNAFMWCSSLTSVSIGNGVKVIGNGAFFNCSRLTSVTIPNSVTEIGYDAFIACSSLTSVTIGNGVKVIGSQAFSDCPLTSVIIPNSVTVIGSNAFADCTSLTSVTIPGSVTEIGREGAFGHCTSLKAITVDGSNMAYSSVDGVLFDKNKGALLEYPGGKNGPYDIPNSVTVIGWAAFSECRSLTSVTIPGSVTEIGGYTFAWCDSLRSVTVKWATPLLIAGSVFSNANTSSATLHVPAGTKALYAAADVWKEFETILEDAGVGTEIIPSAEVQVRVYGSRLSVSSPVAEPVEVYSIGGQLLYRAQKVAGAATFDLNGLPDGVLIVKGNGWTKKIVLNY